MKYQVLISNSGPKMAHLVYILGPVSMAILVDPQGTWEQVQAYLKNNSVELKYILLTQPSFDKAFRVASIKLKTGAKFLAFKSNLIQLGTLPNQADQRNVCGIKIPQVDGFLEVDQSTNLGGIEVQVLPQTGGVGYTFDAQGLKVQTFPNNP